MLQVAFHIKSVLLIKVRQFFVPLMLGNVEFVAEEWPDTAQLQDTLAAIHDRKFVPAHKFFATMSSDELKKDKYHQRKISFTALVFLYYIIVLKAPT